MQSWELVTQSTGGSDFCVYWWRLRSAGSLLGRSDGGWVEKQDTWKTAGNLKGDLTAMASSFNARCPVGDAGGLPQELNTHLARESEPGEGLAGAELTAHALEVRQQIRDSLCLGPTFR